MKQIEITKIKYRSNLMLLFLCLWTIPTFCFATSYAVSPLLIDKELQKRDIVTEKITITNNEQSVIRIFPTVNEVSVNEGGTVKGFVEPSMITNKAKSITTWIALSRAQMELQPGEKREVTLTIKVDPEVEAGEYHAFIGFPTGSNRPEAEKLLYTGSSPGTVLRIGVNKIQNQFLRLTNFTVDRFIKSSSEGKITFVLTNPGDSPVIPEGEIIFYDSRGTEVGSVPVNTNHQSIESLKELSFSSFVPATLKTGKYKAFLSVEYGALQKTSINDTAFFYVFPLKQLIAIFVSILLSAIVIALFVHRRYASRDVDDGITDVGMYIRQSKSEPKDHDIDLSKKSNS